MQFSRLSAGLKSLAVGPRDHENGAGGGILRNHRKKPSVIVAEPR